jgi:hypothetical protein
MSEATLVVIYPRPTNIEAFEKIYLEQHVPLGPSLGPAILPRMLPTTKCPRVATDAECRQIQLAGLMARAESHRTAGFTRSG